MVIRFAVLLRLWVNNALINNAGWILVDSPLRCDWKNEGLRF